MQLSKSEFLLFLKHPGWLWLKKHDKSKLPPVDEALQALFDDGNLFEEYASKLFPNAVRVGFSFEEKNYMTMPYRTKQAIENGAETILQGRLEDADITCIFDVIQRVGDNKFNLYEIKASNELKEEHIFDLSFQTVVLENAGLKIEKIFVIHANKNYVRKGEIDIKSLTKKDEITTEVRSNINRTKKQIQKALGVMRAGTPPDFSPRYVGPDVLLQWMAIYKVLFPQKHSHNIYQLARLSPDLIGKLEDMQVRLIAEIPDSVNLHPKQQIQVQATRENKRLINKQKIKEFILNLKYPLYFFDYETFCRVIPPFDGIRPYQKIPFQYSLHIIESPGAPFIHREFLHISNSHPGPDLLERLKQDIGEEGTVLVWYEAFEKGRNIELGEMFPEYAGFMSRLNERIVDLMIPFSKNWFVDKDFFGSASLKKVLPILINEYSYEKLNIRQGAEASRLWAQTFLDGKNSDKKEQIIKDLRQYCCLDTLAMVQLFEFLQREVGFDTFLRSGPSLK